MNLFRVAFMAFVSCIFSMSAEESTSDLMSQLEVKFPKSEKKFRINGLWPSDYMVQIPVEPAIPSNFVFKRFPQDECRGYFAWGPKEVFETDDCVDRRLLTQSIIVFEISLDVAQTGPKSFSGEDQVEADYRKEGVKDVFKKKYMWGAFPVLQVGGTKEGKELFCAWIGCNYCSNVIFAYLAYPFKEGRPNKEDREIWKTFLSETKPLSGQDSIQACGWDIQPGYTWMDVTGVKLFSVAERRKRDGLVQIVVIRPDDDTSITPTEIGVGIADKPFFEKEIVKVYANISKKLKEGGSIEMPGAVVNILLKNVEEFSLDKESFHGEKRVFVYQNVFKVNGVPIQLK